MSWKRRSPCIDHASEGSRPPREENLRPESPTPPGNGSRPNAEAGSRWWTSLDDQSRRERFLQADWIKEVATTPDTPIRTHRITLTYSRLADALDYLLFRDPALGAMEATAAKDAATNANWFHFATWGTYTLGPNIRDDSAPQRLDSLPSSLRKRVLPTIIHSRSTDGNVVGRALSWGQKLIFMSSAWALKQFNADISRLSTSGEPFEMSGPTKARMLELLSDGETKWLDMGHLNLIEKAFDCYALIRRRASKLEDPSQDPIVCKLCLFATIVLTAVEQDLVNSALQAVTDAVPVRFVNQLDGRLASLIAKRRDVPREVVAANLLDQVSRGSVWLTETWARFMTNQMLVIVLPTETLRLGRDIPPRDFARPLYPPVLDNLAYDTTVGEEVRASVDPPDVEKVQTYLRELDEMVRALSRTAEDGRGSAARDWRRFDDRLNFAICLFRSRQQDGSIFWPPYSREDEYRIVEGILPHGHSFDGVIPPLDPNAIGKFLALEARLDDSAGEKSRA